MLLLNLIFNHRINLGIMRRPSARGARGILLGACAVAIAACTGGSGSAKPPADSGNDPPLVGPVAEHGQLAVVGTQLRDQAGSPVQLKGVSSQWLNYESRPYPESKDGLAYARDHWKLSVIRAAMGTETKGGYLNSATGKAAMQDKVNTIIQNAIDLGIYVIVDWHTSAAVTATTTQQADAVAFFTDIAQRYGNTPNVIYEPFNEPRRVTWAQIKPYHEAVVAAIRAVDPDNLIVLGTPTFSQDVDIAAKDPVAGTNLLYTLHFYACTHKQPLRDKANAALGLGAPLFITEFGATPSDGGTPGNGDNIVCEDEANNWFSWMATNGVSGAGWKLDQCVDASCLLTYSAPVNGPWTDDLLTSDAGGSPVDGGGVQVMGGHGQFVVNWIRQ
jgi:endoglucanase